MTAKTRLKAERRTSSGSPVLPPRKGSGCVLRFRNLSMQRAQLAESATIEQLACEVTFFGKHLRHAESIRSFCVLDSWGQRRGQKPPKLRGDDHELLLDDVELAIVLDLENDLHERVLVDDGGTAGRWLVSVIGASRLRIAGPFARVRLARKTHERSRNPN